MYSFIRVVVQDKQFYLEADKTVTNSLKCTCVVYLLTHPVNQFPSDCREAKSYVKMSGEFKSY